MNAGSASTTRRGLAAAFERMATSGWPRSKTGDVVIDQPPEELRLGVGADPGVEPAEQEHVLDHDPEAIGVRGDVRDHGVRCAEVSSAP